MTFACEAAAGRWGVVGGGFGTRVTRNVPSVLPRPGPCSPTVGRTPGHGRVLAPRRGRLTLHGTLHCFPGGRRTALTPRFTRRLHGCNHVCVCHFHPSCRVGTHGVGSCPRHSIRTTTVVLVVGGGLSCTITRRPRRLVACKKGNTIFRG